jgi:hypothetical protein
MKTLLFFIITGVAMVLVFRGGSFLKSSYNSELIGVSFSFPTRMTVSSDSNEYVGISYPKPSANQVLIHRRVISNLSSPLSFTVSRDFSPTASNEQSGTWGRNGLIFSWKSTRGTERAFAFTDRRYLYIVTTSGIDAKGQSVKDLENISKSITLTD